MPQQKEIWSSDDGQDIAEYAVLLMLVIALVVGSVRLVATTQGNFLSALAFLSAEGLPYICLPLPSSFQDTSIDVLAGGLMKWSAAE